MAELEELEQEELDEQLLRIEQKQQQLDVQLLPGGDRVSKGDLGMWSVKTLLPIVQIVLNDILILCDLCLGFDFTCLSPFVIRVQYTIS